MANKRNLKKYVRYVCGDIAGECLFAESAFQGIDLEKMDQVIVRAAIMQEEALSRISVSFDKTPSDFKGNLKEYKKQRRAYFRAVVAGIDKYMKETITEIANDMNAIVPAAIREVNK